MVENATVMPLLCAEHLPDTYCHALTCHFGDGTATCRSSHGRMLPRLHPVEQSRGVAKHGETVPFYAYAC